MPEINLEQSKSLLDRVKTVAGYILLDKLDAKTGAIHSGSIATIASIYLCTNNKFFQEQSLADKLEFSILSIGIVTLSGALAGYLNSHLVEPGLNGLSNYIKKRFDKKSDS